jgi:O-antigen ligase
MSRHFTFDKFIPNLIRSRFFIGLVIITASAAAGYFGKRFPPRLLITVLSALEIPLIAYVFGISFVTFLYIYAALVWLPAGFNYFFLNPVLLQAKLPEVGLYFGLGLLLIGTLSRRGDRARQVFSAPYLSLLIGFTLGGIIAFLSGPGSKGPEAFIYLRRAAIYNLAIYMVIVTLLRKPAQGITLLKMLVVGGTVAGIYLSFQIGGVWDPLARFQLGRAASYTLIGETEASTIFVQVATYLSTLLPIAIALAFHSRRRSEVVLFGFLALLLGLMLFVSEGRGGWIAGTVSGLLVVGLNARLRKVKIWRPVLIAILVLVAASALVSSGILGETFFNRLYTFASLQTDSSLIVRLQLWQRDLELILQNPFGVGFFYNLEVFRRSAHNEFLQLTLGSGILGLLCILAFFMGVVRKFIRGLQDPDNDIQSLCIAALGVMVALFINGIPDNPSTNSTWTWPVIWITIATTIGVLHAQQTKAEQISPQVNDKIS